MFELEFHLIVAKIDRKAATHFAQSVQNQLARVEKRFKEARDNLRVTSGGLYNKIAIWPKENVENKWKEVKLTCPSYFDIKALEKDRFDDISIAITNIDKDIEMDLIEKVQKSTQRDIGRR